MASFPKHPSSDSSHSRTRWGDLLATISARWFATPISCGFCFGTLLVLGIRSLIHTPDSGFANLWMIVRPVESEHYHGNQTDRSNILTEEIMNELWGWSWGSLFLHYLLLLFVFLWILWAAEELRALLGLRFGTWRFSRKPAPALTCSQKLAFECDTFLTWYEYAKMFFFVISGLMLFRLLLALSFATIGIGCCAISARRPFGRIGVGGLKLSQSGGVLVLASVRSYLTSIWTYVFVSATQFCASAMMYFFGYYHFGFPGGGLLSFPTFDATAKVLIANHSHCMECIMVWSLAGAASFVSKRENLGIPGFRSVCEACDAVLVSRDSRSSRVECVDEIRRRASNHRSKLKNNVESESELSTVSTAAATASSANPSPAAASTNTKINRQSSTDKTSKLLVFPEQTELPHRASNSSAKQLLIFPEQTCSNHKCLLKFKKGAFIPGEAVQPVCVRFPYTYFNATMMRVRNRPLNELWILVQTLCQFVNRVEIRVLEKYVPDEREKSDPELFADNVRALMGRHLELPLSPVGFDDVAEFVARQRCENERHNDDDDENRDITVGNVGATEWTKVSDPPDETRKLK